MVRGEGTKRSRSAAFGVLAYATAIVVGVSLAVPFGVPLAPTPVRVTIRLVPSRWAMLGTIGGISGSPTKGRI